MLENSVKDLVDRFKVVLNSKENVLKCFTKYEVQVEGWLKGEMLFFLDGEREAGRISSFDREVPSNVAREENRYYS